MVYGIPDIRQREQIDRPATISIIGEDLFSMPPGSNPAGIKAEMEAVSKFYSGADSKMKEECIRIDKNVMHPFLNFCEKNGLGTFEKEVEELLEYTRVPIMTLKYFYNRPRPFQQAAYIMPGFRYMPSCSAMSPSYPSGHTVQAGVICDFYSRKYPQFASSFEKVADRVAVSRLIMGVHYPTDNIFAVKMAKKLVQKINAK